jgi:hypothetical protein
MNQNFRIVEEEIGRPRASPVNAYFAFGRFAPYLDRLLRRLSTPKQSSAPLTM